MRGGKRSFDKDRLTSVPKKARVTEPEEEIDDTDLLEKKKSQSKIKEQFYKSDDEMDSSEEEDAKKDEEDMFSGNSFKQKASSLAVEGAEVEEPNFEYEEGVEMKIEPFNMNEELEEGLIDENGHYIKKEDEDAQHDSWLFGMSRKDIAQAKKAQEEKERLALKQKEKDDQDERLQGIPQDEDGLLKKLLEYLQEGDTPLKVISKLGKKTQKPKSYVRGKLRKFEGVENIPEKVEEEKKNKIAIEMLTHISDKLMMLGHHDVYELNYREIMTLLKSRGAIDDTWYPGKEEKSSQSTLVGEWEYKWEETPEQVFGPYSTEDMIAWEKEGYFKSGVLVRKIEEGGQFTSLTKDILQSSCDVVK